MSYSLVRDLLTDPLWQPADLGTPIPESSHAVSVAMPTWESVIGYEEGDKEVLSALQCGYPRFFCHPKVEALFVEATKKYANSGEAAIVLGSLAAGERCRAFIGGEGRLQAWPRAQASVLVFPEAARQTALRYWRYTGEIVSSRQAEAMLAENLTFDAAPNEALIARLASWSQVPCAHVHLYASGMGAIFAAFRAATAGGKAGKTIQLEFPYVDVFCIQKSLGVGSHLLLGDDLVQELEKRLAQETVRAVFCEIPCNPLMRTVDLAKVSMLCRAAGVPLIVDDTLGTVHNVDVYPYADLVTTSLTKTISGRSNVMAGAVWVPPAGPFADTFQRFLTEDNSAPLYSADAAVLLSNSADFPERMDVINGNAQRLAAYLDDRSEVAEVYYPDRQTASRYEAIRRPNGGYGGLISMVLDGGEAAARSFYDALRVSKGPSLGTNFTLACPYTLLAHYEELDWVEKCGVSRNLIRIAVGMEAVDDLKGRFDEAFGSV